jgi:hypothetical protein
MSMNGQESIMLSGRNLKSGDKIGVKLDTIKGMLFFDLNGVEL